MLVFSWQLEFPPALPGNTVHSLLIGGWDQEADGGDHRLASLLVENPPFVGLGVVQQGALIAPVDRDLGGQGTATTTTEVSDVRTGLVLRWRSYTLKTEEECLRQLSQVQTLLLCSGVGFLWKNMPAILPVIVPTLLITNKKDKEIVVGQI